MKKLFLFLFLFSFLGGCGKAPEAPLPVEVTLAPKAVISLPPIPSPSPSPMPAILSSPSPSPLPTPETEATELFPGFSHQMLNSILKKRITGISYPAPGEDCQIDYTDLSYLQILYVDFEGQEQRGELIVHESLSEEVLEIFHALYEARYPLASVRLVDDYGEPGDDNLSMAANNTSSFNYRRVTGSRTLSRHSYGAAIDINPLFNPYLDGDRVAPPEAKAYVDRSRDLPGMIDHEDLCYRLFTEAGWSWGGDWKGDKDYQHFSKDIGY